MKLRKAVAVQIDRLVRVVPLVNMALLIVNLSLVVATTVSWRGWSFYSTTAATAALLMVAGLVFANVWTVGLKMIHASRTAAILHDPTQVYVFTPWERIVWRTAMIPQMENQADIADAEGVESATLRSQIQRLKRWEGLGYIPRDEYPEDLAHLYLNGGRAA